MSNTETPVQPGPGKGTEELAKAQRERPAEETGPAYGHAAVRRVTADELDPHRDWTVQSGRPFPQPDQGRTTRFHPAELPDAQKAVDAGIMPPVIPPALVDDTHVTQPPTANPPLDDPLREKNRDDDPGYKASQQTNITAGLDKIKEIAQLKGTPEDRGGSAHAAPAESSAGDADEDEAQDDSNEEERKSGTTGSASFTPGGSTQA